ncbi:hypothetical protein DM01DRAFT_1335229 [Hesseltinella vesiculosa]|uniref:F-box domain-containing protein n=1 Tax=Hesseltinella vesiculosa TaxID=101127 RepID=A0A1X2GJ30_9FUNG|nr:hypothetical protein DM01DRAFT_1335229 [Hesseltinella vesiculosa]
MSQPLRKRQRISPRRIDFTNGLFSDELILHVLAFLSANDLAQCCQVNHVWNRLANDTMLWKPLFDQRFHQPLCRYQSTWSTAFRRLPMAPMWKQQYRLQHNWLAGLCSTRSIRLDSLPSVLQDMNANQVQNYIQYTRNVICFPNDDRTGVLIWMVHHGQFRLVGQVPLSAHSTLNAILHCIKLAWMSGRYWLAIGNNLGGFEVWTFTIDIDKGLVNLLPLCQSAEMSHALDPVIALDFDSSMLVLCTLSMKLCAYSLTSARPISSLQSPVTRFPVLLTLTHPRSGRWTALLCFGMPVGNGSSCLSVQEMTLSTSSLVSSRYCSVFCPDQLFVTPGTDINMYPPTTSMQYSKPFLMTAHSNNTIRQYRLISTETTLELEYVRTLFGHTCRVDTLAMDTAHGRLVSSDRSCLKIWDLLSLDQARARRGSRDEYKLDYLVTLLHDQHQLDRHTFVDWLQLDEEQILAVVRPQQQDPPMLKVWSFD